MLDAAPNATPLSQLERGRTARVTGFAAEPPLKRRLMDMGFVEEAEVELLHSAPLTRDPLAVRVDAAIIAIRKAEAAHILVSAAAR